MGRKKEQEHKTLARWIIDKTNTDHYRAGMLSGWKHPYIDADVMEIVGGRKQLLDQANILENETNAGKMGKFKPDWKDVKTSIKKIDYDVAIIPELCEREQIEDPRERQLLFLFFSRYIKSFTIQGVKMAEKRTGLCMVVLLL